MPHHAQHRRTGVRRSVAGLSRSGPGSPALTHRLRDASTERLHLAGVQPDVTARAVALPAVVADIEATNDAARTQWRDWFSGQALDNTVIPEPLGSGVITLDRHELRAIRIGQGDIANNTVLHIPALDAVVAGDVIYNGIHPLLALTGPDEWRQWIDSVDKIAALNPRTVVAGHKRPELPDDVAATVAGTRDYIGHFINEVDDSADSRDMVARIQQRYPNHGNPSALILSAVAAFKRKRHAAN